MNSLRDYLFYEEPGITLYCGDCRTILPLLDHKVPLIITDPPYSVGRSETEFQASGNIAVALHLASTLCETLMVFGTSSGRGYEFIRSSIRALPHCRTLVWHRSFVNSPAAGPWRWDLVFIHVFGEGAFGRPEHSSLLQTNGTQALAIELGHKAPIPIEVMQWLARPFAGRTMLDPFCGSGSLLEAAKRMDRRAIGIEIEPRYCEIAVKRLRQEVLPFGRHE
jgi:site-specific DNA-methyltransferase (adenine-specific)